MLESINESTKEIRNKTISLCMNQSEFAMFKKICEYNHLPQSSMIRKLIVDEYDRVQYKKREVAEARSARLEAIKETARATA